MGPTISDPVAPNTSLNRPSAQAVSLSPSGHLHGSLSQARFQRLTVVPTLLHPSPSSPFCAGPSPLRSSFSTSLHHTGPDSGPIDTPMSGGVRPHMASRASSGQTRATHTQAPRRATHLLSSQTHPLPPLLRFGQARRVSIVCLPDPHSSPSVCPSHTRPCLLASQRGAGPQTGSRGVCRSAPPGRLLPSPGGCQ